MNAIGVIPARYKSTRLEGKALADMAGKPMIQRVYEAARASAMLDDVVVATDDERIAVVVREFGGKAALTSRSHETGTDRIIEVINPIDVKVVVNIQGDEPLVHYTMIDELVSCLLVHPKVPMATVIKKIEKKEEVVDPNFVKVVIDRDGYALYFSRSPIPFERAGPATIIYKHIGIYAYTKDFLFMFKNLPPSYLEKVESLEQLRVLENGYKIKTIETVYDTVGVDTAVDLEKATAMLREREAKSGKARKS
jgi:3-deoxy-manno-octulosonate cytidylyltransferase (CMP-KDO synthetase)